MITTPTDIEDSSPLPDFINMKEKNKKDSEIPEINKEAIPIKED